MLGDFNSILYSGDRMAGTEIQDFEVWPLADCIASCKLQQLRHRGPCFTWTNKTVWSRIDRVCINTLWFNLFDYSQTHYLPSSILDHIPMVIESPHYPMPPRSFHFCVMWIKESRFLPTVSSHLSQSSRPDPGLTLQVFISRVKTGLLHLHRIKFADLHTQQIKAKIALEDIQLQL